ncbi:putative integral membrane protein [Aspergillus campestris IBT 28561]|uniref:Integral membrane protein n=1 Tax=Aspergillus campestris (strain IBT 28561) TaxID=1392248 RepID=A0A2I1CZW0_ASPC2|nr:putative integral membrane protein [Aspergillus campestris IBT 28561]PKY03164.1 putative integral membrane protein [Aspergillus campestris IBT 28561]
MSIGVARGREALVVSAIFTTLSTILTAIRIYTRAFLVRQMGSDDWSIIVSLAFSWGFFGLFVGETKYLMGEHFLLIPTDIYTKQMMCFWASVPIYQASLITTKASILLQYRRVFSTTPRMRFACWCLIGFLVVYGVWVFISAWLNCIPVAKFWDDDIPGYCLNKKALWFSNSGIHIFTDVLLLIYPMPVLRSLQLPKRQKFAIMGVFALGIFVLITSILRLKSLLVISNSADPTYDNPSAATWSAVECNVAIICACLPATKAFISRLVPRFFSTGGNTYKYQSRSKYIDTHGGGGRSHNPHVSNVQTSIAAYNNRPEYHMSTLKSPKDPRTNSVDSKVSSSSGGEDQAQRGEIKVTTMISTQFGSGAPRDGDDDSSVQNLVLK